MEKPENRTSSQISSGQLSLADLMPESVKRVFKASKKHNQVYLEGIDTLVNDNDLGIFVY